MKIGIDARFLTHPQPGGFKTYTENLIEHLAIVDGKNEYILYLDRPIYEGCKVPDAPNFASKVVSSKLPAVGMIWREQVGLALEIARDRVDVFHSPCLTTPLGIRCPLVITIHDMIWAFPEKFSSRQSKSLQRNLMELYFRLVPKYGMAKASAIITVSHAAKDSIVENMGIHAEDIFVTHAAANPAFQLNRDGDHIQAIRQKHGLPFKYILAIGSADPRKNISTLIDAYALLPKELQNEWPLVIVWTHSLLAGELSKQIENLVLNDRIKTLEKVSTEDLILLYNAASLFAFPSRYEGFGLPLLEAMSCGVPVVAANNSSIPEIVGDAALLFDAENQKAIAEKIEQVLCQKDLRHRLIQEGLARVTHFSWEKCARETLTVYENVFHRRN